MQRDRRGGDRGLRGGTLLEILASRIAGRVAVAMAIGLDRGVDEVRIVERVGAARESPLIVNDSDLAVRAALDGVGIVFLLENRVCAHIAAGTLVRLLEDWTLPFRDFYLDYSSRRQTSPPLRAFAEFATAGTGADGG